MNVWSKCWVWADWLTSSASHPVQNMSFFFNRCPAMDGSGELAAWTQHPFSGYIKITAFSPPRSNKQRKDLDLFPPVAADLNFYSTRYYAQTNSKSTFPVHIPIITIKPGLIFYDGCTFKCTEMSLRTPAALLAVVFGIKCQHGLKQNITSYSQWI